MKHLIPLLILATAAVSSASTVFSNISVNCVHNPSASPNTTESLTVTVDPTLNGGTITAGAIATNNYFFNLAGNALSAPFTDGTYNYSSALDTVCYFVGGFCFTGSGPVSLDISTVPAGRLFHIIARSVETKFTLPDGGTTGGGTTGTPPPVPEPGSLILLGCGLTIFGFASRKRLTRS